MSDKVRMIAPHLTVLMDDGAVHHIQANNFDMLIYERTARKKGWPSPQEAQIEWMTYLAWHGLVRESQISKDTSYEDFVAGCVSIDPTPVDVDPTLPVPETG